MKKFYLCVTERKQTEQVSCSGEEQSVHDTVLMNLMCIHPSSVETILFINCNLMTWETQIDV